MLAQPQPRHGSWANRCAGFRRAHRIGTSARKVSHNMHLALPQPPAHGGANFPIAQRGGFPGAKATASQARPLPGKPCARSPSSVFVEGLRYARSLVAARFACNATTGAGSMEDTYHSRLS
jgi:hypothetical protein